MRKPSALPSPQFPTLSFPALSFPALSFPVLTLGALALISLLVAAPTVAQVPSGEPTRTFEQGRVQAGADGAILPERQRVEVINRLLADRLDDLLPRLMAETGIDLWLVINREYAEDPVYLTLVPEPAFAARRTTMLAFHLPHQPSQERDEAMRLEPQRAQAAREADDHDHQAGHRDPERRVRRMTVSRYPLGDYEQVWEGGDLDQQWQRLGELVRELDPRHIGINVSRNWPVADGLTASLRDRLEEALGPETSRRLVSAEELVVRWIETRTAAEQEVYPHVVALARGVIAEAFSDRVITPGVTTTDDIAWYLRQRFADLHLPVWFMPYVNVQRPGEACAEEDPFCGVEGIVHRGDVVHTDVGICYLRLCTDTQEMGYVLKLGETEPPAGLVDALAVGNRWQDLLTQAFDKGRTGNEILAAARRAAGGEGIVSSVYTHPLGFFGHAPGPTIGMWDNQGPTAIRGDWPLHPDTGYAIEGNVKVRVPEWDDQWLQIKLEQSAVWDGRRVLYLAGRQTEWHVVP